MNFRVIAKCLITMLVLAAALPAVAARQQVVLFTEEEARELRIEDDQWDPVPRARSAMLGPVIVVHQPEVRSVDGGETIETSTPTTMMVVFEENEAPVDMSTLEIQAKKGIFSKSLTDMLKPFVSGTTLAVENIEVPSGKYQIQIAVEDLEGHETTRTYRLVVNE